MDGETKRRRETEEGGKRREGKEGDMGLEINRRGGKRIEGERR